MERIESPELEQAIIDHLAGLYNIHTKREGIHLSSIVGCLTRSFWNEVNYTIPTHEETMLFSLGYALQDVLTPDTAEAPIYSLEGITYSPDYQIKLSQDITAEIKTTRMSADKPLSELWIDYMMGGCYILGIKEYHLAVLYLMGSWKPPFPELKVWKITFTDEELMFNWSRLMERKTVYTHSLEINRPPQPFEYCREYECKSCKFKMQCQALSYLDMEKL